MILLSLNQNYQFFSLDLYLECLILNIHCYITPTLLGMLFNFLINIFKNDLIMLHSNIANKKIVLVIF